MIPGEIIVGEGEIELKVGRTTVQLQVANTDDRPIQVGSHFHFYEVNTALYFDRERARGRRLDIPAGTAVRFEPGDEKEVILVPFVGSRQIYGFNGKIQGDLDENSESKLTFVTAPDYCNINVLKHRILSSSEDSRKTYPVGWLPYLADWKRYVMQGSPIFRYYNPEEIDGVGILMGIKNGKIYGDSLKRKQCEELVLYPKSDGHYSWLLAPGGNILYKWNSQLQLDSRNYTRHSDLNSGKPVICAGEFYISQQIFLEEVYIELNDSSGHYKPEGNQCFKYVLEEFEKIGISVDNVRVYTRS